MATPPLEGVETLPKPAKQTSYVAYIPLPAGRDDSVKMVEREERVEEKPVEWIDPPEYEHEEHEEAEYVETDYSDYDEDDEGAFAARRGELEYVDSEEVDFVRPERRKWKRKKRKRMRKRPRMRDGERDVEDDIPFLVPLMLIPHSKDSEEVIIATQM